MIANYVYGYLRNQEETAPSGKVSPSAINGCPRAVMYRLLRVPATNNLPDIALVNMMVGKYMEKLVIDALRAGGLLLAEGYVGETDVLIGVIDAVIEGPRPVEIKNINSAAFRWTKDGSGPPYPNHMRQAAFYKMLGYNGQEFLNPILFYIGRGTVRIQEFEIAVTDNHITAIPVTSGVPRRIKNDLRERIEKTKELMSSGKIPERPFERPDEHPYLCLRNGRPNCKWFGKCWT